MKIVWICHFNTKEIRELLAIPPAKQTNDFAPWIPAAISGFEQMNDPNLELHIVAPYRGLSSLTKRVKLRNVHYHFFKPDIPLVHGKWKGIPVLFRSPLFKQYWTNRILVKKIINGIKPDIITLWGAENPYYSRSVLDFVDKIPILVILQGMTSDPKVREHLKTDGTFSEELARSETEILKACKYYGSGVQFMTDIVKDTNPAAVVYEIGVHRLIYDPPANIAESERYDIVFFARLNKLKGIEDLLKALSFIKKHKPDVSMKIIGPPSTPDYEEHIKGIVKNSGLDENVKMLGPIPDHSDLLAEIAKARISVLPTYFDGLPNTISESIFMGVPVIAYETGLIPSLNDGDERIVIVERGNIDELGKQILRLLNEPDTRSQYAQKARQHLLEIFDNKRETQRIIDICKDILIREGKN